MLKLNEDFTTNIEDPINAGEGLFHIYLIPEGPVVKNYKNLTVPVTKNLGIYEIKPRSAYVSTDEKVTTYGTELPLTITVGGIVSGEEFVEGQDYTISREQGKDVGSYNITPQMIDSGPVAKNYDFREVKSANYIINPADATIKADDISKIYMQDDPEFSATGIGLQYGEVLELGIDFNVSRAQGEAAGDYVITPTVLESEKTKNYNLSVETGILTINKFTDFEHVVISQVPDQTYSGRKITPELTITYTFENSDNAKTVTLIAG